MATAQLCEGEWRGEGAERALSARVRGRDCCKGRGLASAHTVTGAGGTEPQLPV